MNRKWMWLLAIMAIAFCGSVQAQVQLDQGTGITYQWAGPSLTTPVMVCPIGKVCGEWKRMPDNMWVRSIQDGPDGWPSVVGRGPYTPRPFDGTEEVIERFRRERADRYEADEEDDVVVERVEPESVCSTDACTFGCQDSTGECEQKRKDTCASKHGTGPHRGVNFSRVTKYEEGKACEFTCVTASGDLKLYSCERAGKKKGGGGAGTAALMP